MTLYELQMRVASEMDRKDVDVETYGMTLYLRKNKVSDAIIDDYDFKWMVTKFIDNIDHVVWYDVPFAKFPVNDWMK